MDLEVLVATMNQQGFELVDKMNIDSQAIIINQCNKISIHEFENNQKEIKWINSNKKGLSRSRNQAIKNATSDICLIADDDLEYVANYEEVILEQFKLNPEIDIIAFQVEGIDEKFKEYHKNARNLNYLTSMKVSSVEIAFRLSSVKEKGIRFNELFGAGSKYFLGEENIFLFECLKQGLKLGYRPIKIADLNIGESTWFTSFNYEYFIAKGAMFAAMSRKLSVLLIIQFAIRKRSLYSDRYTTLEIIRIMLKGRNEYLIECEKNKNIL